MGLRYVKWLFGWVPEQMFFRTPHRRQRSCDNAGGAARSWSGAVRGVFLACLLAVPGMGTVIPVNSGGNLALAVSSATAGDTILVGPGTYPLTNTLSVNKALTIRSSAGPASTFLTASGSGSTFPILLSANNVILDGFSLSGGAWGIFAGDISNVSHFSNIQIRNMTVDTVSSAVSPGHGIYVHMLNSSVVEHSSVVK